MNVCSIGLQWFKSFEPQLTTCWMATREITCNRTFIITRILLLCIDYRRKDQFLIFHNATIRRLRFKENSFPKISLNGFLSYRPFKSLKNNFQSCSISEFTLYATFNTIVCNKLLPLYLKRLKQQQSGNCNMIVFSEINWHKFLTKSPISRPVKVSR